MTDSIYASSGESLNRVNRQAEDMATLDGQSEKGYAVLGWMLLEVSQMGYWKIRFETWRQYLDSVAKLSKKSVAQLQTYFLTVRDLSGSFTSAELEAMGISKALKLRTAQDYAIVLPGVLKNAALNPLVTVKELKQLISQTLNMVEEDDGDWMDCGMEFMVTPEQRAMIEQAIDVAKHTKPLTKASISESAQMLDVMTKFCQEFLGSHCGDGE